MSINYTEKALIVNKVEIESHFIDFHGITSFISELLLFLQFVINQVSIENIYG